jgi:hypothetical protein
VRSPGPVAANSVLEADETVGLLAAEAVFFGEVALVGAALAIWVGFGGDFDGAGWLLPERATSALAVDFGLDGLVLEEAISLGALLLEEDLAGAVLAVVLVEVDFEEVDFASGFGVDFTDATVLGFAVVVTALAFGLVVVDTTGLGLGLLTTGAGAVFGAGIT